MTSKVGRPHFDCPRTPGLLLVGVLGRLGLVGDAEDVRTELDAIPADEEARRRICTTSNPRRSSPQNEHLTMTL